MRDVKSLLLFSLDNHSKQVGYLIETYAALLWTASEVAYDEPGHQARLVQQERQQYRVEAAREVGPDQDRPVVDGNEGPDHRGQCSEVGAGDARLPQRHHRQEGEDADGNDPGFHGAKTDITKGDAFILPFDDRIQRDGGADEGKGDNYLQERAQEHVSI